MARIEIRPGNGYLVRERLGSGQWKEVYRAVQKRDWRDVALLRFIEPPSVDTLLRELRALDPSRIQPSENVAELYSPFKGDDGQVYLVEELIYRPLDKVSPLGSIGRFADLARGLFAGLAGLHGQGFIHRDLKLENCGLDFSDRAKIFDLGSITSEGSHSFGSILTRAPELFKENSKCTKQSDIWALGATLLALRTGHYPFAMEDEWKNRPPANRKGEDDRKLFEARIRQRALGADVEQRIASLVTEAFPPKVRELMGSLLSISPNTRSIAEDARYQWEELAASWFFPATEASENKDAAILRQFEQYLISVVNRQAGMSPRQWDKTVQAIERLAEKMGEDSITRLRDLQHKVRILRLDQQFR